MPGHKAPADQDLIFKLGPVGQIDLGLFVVITQTDPQPYHRPAIRRSPWGGWWFYDDRHPPPESDAIPHAYVTGRTWRHRFFINRHDGYVNGLFMDWSVRRVGLKELWTLKWHRQFETNGPWTKAGGARSEDWLQWMKRFKDY